MYTGTTAFPTVKCGAQPPLTTIIQKRRLTLFGHLVRMDESADARRILTAVPQSEWRRPVGRLYTSWMATLKNALARHNLTLEDAIELALNKPLWRLLAASGAMLCTDGACQIMMMMVGTPTLSLECQSVWMSKITNDGLTRSVTG